MRSLTIQLLIGALSLSTFGQSTLDSVLANVKKNNKTLQAETQYWESQKLQYKNGLTPVDPTVEYDHLSGSPSTAGTQVEFTISQSIDFPTSYIKKKQVAKEKIAQSTNKFQSTRQDILLLTKQVCLELIYRNKLNVELNLRKEKTDELVENYQKKLDAGAGNLLDVNKSRLQQLEIHAEYFENSSAISALNKKLIELNGGNPIEFKDTEYPAFILLPNFEELEKEYEINDPVKKIFEQEKMITQKQLELSRAMWLPKMEAGYHYQGILGQQFSGFHAGISIPLWEHKNTVKQKKVELKYKDLLLQDHLTEHYYEIKALYDKYTGLKSILEKYQVILNSSNNAKLLDKALASGEISAIEYFMEMSFYRNAYSKYLETEMEYHLVVAELFKFKL